MGDAAVDPIIRSSRIGWCAITLITRRSGSVFVTTVLHGFAVVLMGGGGSVVVLVGGGEFVVVLMGGSGNVVVLMGDRLVHDESDCSGGCS